jgi:hypothetical protein
VPARPGSEKDEGAASLSSRSHTTTPGAFNRPELRPAAANTDGDGRA